MLRRVAMAGLVLAVGCAADGERARQEPTTTTQPSTSATATSATAAAPDAGAPPAAPPDAGPPPRDDDFVDVAALIPDAVLDLRYATANNFTGAVLYPKAVCKLRRAVAARLVQAAELLRAQDRRLLLWDCYRPSSIQERFWKLVPDSRYVADPKKGSRHSRGAAVDLALVDRDGKRVVIPTEFDEFTEAAHRARALAGPKGAEAKRLEQAMLDAGFTGMPTEWWHFDAPESGRYALSNEPL